MKLLVLIIAHDDPIYIGMQEQWKRYMNNFDNIKCYFIKYKTDIENYAIIDESANTIYIKGKESLIPGCLDKTIKSLYYLLDKNYEFDYLLRTNLSSVWNFDILCDFIKNNKFLIAGVQGKHKLDRVHFVNFIAGSGILLHIDMCKILMNNRHLLNYNIIDDVALGILLKQYINSSLKVYLNRFEMYNYENKPYLINKNMIQNYSHIRCKFDKKRQNTVELMKIAINLIYN